MIEAAMYLALGFCTAGLIGLAVLPAFYRRAARLTEEALRAVNPSSYAEVRAAQDQERARHAVEFRRVEARLDREREKAAKFHIDATRTLSDIEALKRTHQEQIAALEAKQAEQASDRHAVDLLSAEVKTLKQKLSETEKALTESWAKAPAEAPENESPGETVQEDADGWLPATETMELAAITGLEAEVATLKAKLARYEPTVAGEVEAALNEASKTRLAELEAQLVDTEAQYVAAQAEVTRLSLMLEAANVSDTGPDRQMQTQLEKMTAEITSQRAELEDKDRKLRRLSGQMQTLRSDLAATPQLTELRKDFRALARQLAQTAQASADHSLASARTAAPEPAQDSPDRQSTSDPSRSVGGTSSSPAHSETPGGSSAGARSEGSAAPARPRSPAPAKSADIASAAEALVSRIVASSRSASGTAPATTSPPVPAPSPALPPASAPASASASAPTSSNEIAAVASKPKAASKRAPGSSRKSKPAKPKNKIVA